MITRKHLAPPESGSPAEPEVCRRCGGSVRPDGRHLLPTLDDNHRAVRK